MSTWYNKVTLDPLDLSPLVDCISYFEKELLFAKKETRIQGSLEKSSAMLPGIVEHRYSQLQEIEAILKYLNIVLSRKRHSKFREYFEKYQKALTSRDAEKYAENDKEVYELSILVNRFALLRNQWLAIFKALDFKGYQLANIIKLRVAGLEDSEININ